MLDLLKIIKELKDKKVGFISLKENIDTTTPQGEFQLNVFAAMYQFERQCSKERQREGIDLALAEGRAYGRPQECYVDDNFKAVYKQWKAGDITAVKAMGLVGMKKVTFYKRVKSMNHNNSNIARSGGSISLLLVFVMWTYCNNVCIGGTGEILYTKESFYI